MNIDQLLVDLSVSALADDKRTVRSCALTACRLLKKRSPELAKTIASALAHKDVGGSPLRSVGFVAAPQDDDSRLSLARVEVASTDEAPVFSKGLLQRINRFLQQHMGGEKLLAQGIRPPSSLLLIGEPGVGKTLLASFLAKEAGRKLVVLDLAASVSSLLGKTGQNLRSVFDYAREFPSVLLLDEFDSIAKRRNDSSDLGELKRIVNVLLKELEDWPVHSLLVAATNHPELLDKAIWRRFDEVFEIPVPSREEREHLISRNSSFIPEELQHILIEFTDGMSAADFVQLCNRVSRRIIIDDKVEIKSVVEELVLNRGDQLKKQRAKLCKLLKKNCSELTYEEIASSIGVGASTVFYHLKGKSNGR